MKGKVLLKISIFLLLTYSIGLQAQEICDNAIDDDNDGLIDINDDECECAALINSSLIPNPSFEEMICCPNANAQLNCAVGWTQASPPTTDYVHTCGNYLGNTNIPAFAPLPFPDGNGAVGFRNGEANTGGNYKEYVGACLNETMIPGISYRIDFFVGFRNNIPGNGEIDIAVFGSASCSNLPFGSNVTVGCPVNTGNYDQLDEINVTGNNEWVKVSFEFTPDEAYAVIVLGPTCELSSNYLQNPYFYIDGLNLAKSNEFGQPFSNISGSICSDNLELSIESEPNHTYQWYKDGVAILGKTDPRLSLEASSNEAGTYVLLITTPETCYLSEEYLLRIPPYFESDTVRICEGMTHRIGSEEFNTAGNYEVLLNASDGCDSIVLLNLKVAENSKAEKVDSFCQGEEYIFNDIVTSESGIYNTVLQNVVGCDSFISIELFEIKSESYITIKDTFDAVLGQLIDIVPDAISPSVVGITWTNSQGEIIGTGEELNSYKTFENTLITVEAYDKNGCSQLIPILIRVDRSNLGIYIPNVFSPNEDGINDVFKIYSSPSVQSVKDFRIFDRWGNLIYQEENVLGFDSFIGWDGTIRGNKAEIGVYIYVLAVNFVDNTEELLSGDFSLIR